MASSLSYLSTPEGRLAYHRYIGKSNLPGVLFLGGFMSDMTGSKAMALQAACEAQDRSFVRFDYYGHGVSEGEFTQGTIGIWKANVLAVLDQLTEGPQILVGSSMGGWLMILAALERPRRLVRLVGVASAPDFTEEMIWKKMSPLEREQLMREGLYLLRSDYNARPYPISRTLIEEARAHFVLARELPISLPVTLLHGMKDDDVPYAYSLKLSKRLQTEAVELRFFKEGDHRMSSPAMISQLVASVLGNDCEKRLNVLETAPFMGNILPANS